MAAAPDVDSESDACFSDVNDDVIDCALTDGESDGTAATLVDESSVTLLHPTLHTEFTGVQHQKSTPDAEVHQYRGIKYASVPMRFRRSIVFDKYGSATDATRHGPISPQIKNRWLESRLYGLPKELVPKPAHVPLENEFECLNLTVTVPSPACIAKHGPLPVMVYIHGGGNVTGSGTDWIWDAGALVRKSVQIGKPVVAVAFNFRLGLLGFGASEILREDNAAAGEEGVGNYGLHDQRTALMWIRKYISGFGGDPHNITLFGSSWGAADIHAHLLSAANVAEVNAPTHEEGPLFHRAILQSGALVPSSSVVQDIGSAGRHLARIMSALHITTVEQLRAVPAAKLVALTGERVRPVDDGVFLRKDWRTLALPYAGEKAGVRWRQDVIIGDVACESVLWAIPAKLWGADAVARRARAIVQSVRRADALMRAYDIVDAEKGAGNGGSNSPPREAGLNGSAVADDDEEGSNGSGSEDGEGELAERVMELINDVAFAWPVDVAARCAADSAFVFEEHTSTIDEGSESDPSFSSEVEIKVTPSPSRPPNAPYVYRYVFDQASPYTGMPHHGVDLLYLFGNIPFPQDPELTPEENEEVNWDRQKVRDEVQERWLVFAHGEEPWDALTPQPPAGVASMSDKGIFATPMLSPVSSFAVAPSLNRPPLSPAPSVYSPASSRSSSFSVSSRSASFSGAGLNPFHTGHHAYAHHHHHTHHHAHGHGAHHAQLPPISISESDKVFVFGPEGETGTRSAKIFAGRRRVHAWREALAPLGLAIAQKVGLELGNGPPDAGAARF